MSVIDGTSGNDTITPGLITAGVVGTPSAFPNDGDDELHGHAGNDYLVGGGGTDWLFGDDFDSERGNDTLDGGSGNDFLVGHAGNDTYIVDSTGDQIIESSAASGGIDTVRSATIGIDLANYGGNTSGIENIVLTGSLDLSINASSVNNVITGNNGSNVIFAYGGNDIVSAGGGNDVVFGGGGNDLIDAQQGADIVYGGAGNDTILGGPGADTLLGGAGRDVFKFGAAIGSVPGAVDQIFADEGSKAFDGAGAAAGDKLDMSGIDANATTMANEAFVFGGTGKGHVSVIDSGTDTIVRANMDNDAAFEFQLVIHDGNVHASAYTAADFIL